MARRPAPHSSATPVRKRPSLDFSLTGLVYCSIMMFMGLAAVNTQANLLFGVFGLMIGVLLVATMISRLVLRKLVVKRVLPEQAVVGEEVALRYEFTNAKRFWPSFSVTLSELDAAEAFVKQPLAYMLHAAPRMTAQVTAQTRAKRRGLHALDRFQLSTSFPFGFVKRAMDRRQPDTLLVFPALARVDSALLALCRSADQSGATMRPRRGGDDEFYGVKEHRAGDNPRHIYWRRSARTGVLVAKEMTQVSPPRLLLLVDTHLEDRSVEAHVRVERTIAMAASLASHALAEGLAVGLVAWGTPARDAAAPSTALDYEPAARPPPGRGAPPAPDSRWLTLAPSRGKRHRRDLLAHLAQLPLNTRQDTHALLTASHEAARSGATPVLFTAREIQLGLAEQQRTNLVVVWSLSAEADRWFRFDPSVDFARSMPWDQQPEVPAPPPASHSPGPVNPGARLPTPGPPPPRPTSYLPPVTGN